jgi:hypothetical protein
MSNKPEWIVSDVSNAMDVGELEFKDDHKEWHHFSVIKTKERLVFGGCCNCGFIESGYMLREEGLCLDEQLQELYEQLQAYYNQGSEYAPDLICNERM